MALLLLTRTSRAFVVSPVTSATSSRRMAGHVASLNVASDFDQQQQQQQLLPPRQVSEKVFVQDKRPIILFDGVCNLCNGAVNLGLDWDPNGKLRFAALQSNVGRSLLQANGRGADDISSIVLVTQDGAYTKSDAVLRISEALTPLRLLPLKPISRLGRYVVPRFLRDIIYDGVADNRYDLLGKTDQCRFDADGEFEDRFVDDQLAFK
eukprot:CAMPEP_0119561388 /NCGR_PEP_ID=MMETSP1352-20130426/17438_1 /TAXON_ID=265584 /ORGANISM="Stauroneis constricta, Strain CCMP1120" /LENGTH=207 /DNA_ID=CAMNT_0007609577 /DNA_START=117 /DNA_END=740 /DNA_ORIENTATION=+